MIVCDVGCAPHDGDESIGPLVERYHPSSLYGFDPWPGLDEGRYNLDGTRVVLARKAAWIRDGEIRLALAGIDSTVMRAKNRQREWGRQSVNVPCFDLAAWIRAHGRSQIILKLDCEGAEFPLLDRLLETGADQHVGLLLVEWHDDVMPDYSEQRYRLTQELRCPVQPWSPRVPV